MMTRRHLQWSGALLLILAGSLMAAAQQTPKAPADLDPESHARLPYVQRKDLDEKAQQIFDKLPGRRPDGALGGPLAFAAYNPAVAQALFDLHNAAVEQRRPQHFRVRRDQGRIRCD